MKEIIPMLIAIVCTTVFVGVVILGFFGSIADLYKAWMSRKWPRAIGRLLSKSIEISDHDGLSYYPKVEYKYYVNGMTYYSTNIGYLGMHSLSEENAEELIGHLQVNKSLDVFYNPIDPEDAVLVTGLIRGHLSSIIFILIFSAIVAGLVFEWVRKIL